MKPFLNDEITAEERQSRMWLLAEKTTQFLDSLPNQFSFEHEGNIVKVTVNFTPSSIQSTTEGIY